MAMYYIKDDGEQKVDVIVEYDLIEVAPDFMTPKLVFLFFKPEENIEDFEQHFFNDALIAQLIDVNGLAYFAGARYLEGWIELYYYTKDSKLLRQNLAQRLPANLHHELSSKADDKWKFFFESLRPNAFEKLSMENRYVLNDLKDAGDDLESLHEFDHTFFFHTKSQREKVRDQLVALGHKVEDEVVDDFLDARFVLVTQHSGSATLDEVNSFTKLISEITEKSKGYYDGWSTTMKDNV
ncbi:MAG: ribonuclease E inhibitor RraB [Thiovulaceae bacterium]|nr:ribonuclease E inhibitor RraB [Sulfurimonadaceae bacterium]